MIRAHLNQAMLKKGQKLPKKVLERVLGACSGALRINTPTEISIAFVSAATIRRLNRVWRGKDRVTDVLAFELGQGELRGELLVCYSRAAVQAKEMGHCVRDELSFLLVHGILHLWGFDHERPGDAQKMFSLQEKILRKLKIDPRL